MWYRSVQLHVGVLKVVGEGGTNNSSGAWRQKILWRMPPKIWCKFYLQPHTVSFLDVMLSWRYKRSLMNCRRLFALIWWLLIIIRHSMFPSFMARTTTIITANRKGTLRNSQENVLEFFGPGTFICTDRVLIMNTRRATPASTETEPPPSCAHIDTYLICECICAWMAVSYSILSYRCHKSLKMHWCTSSQWWCGDYPGAHYAFFFFYPPSHSKVFLNPPFHALPMFIPLKCGARCHGAAAASGSIPAANHDQQQG